MAELQARAVEEHARKQRELERASVLRTILSHEARQRLANLRLVRPEIVEKVEAYLVQLAQTGKIRNPLGDDELRLILDRLMPPKRDTKIERR